MTKLTKRLRRTWLCWKFNICKTHGRLKREYTGYGGSTWLCEVCVRENDAKSERYKEGSALARVRALEELNRDWAIPVKDKEE